MIHEERYLAADHCRTTDPDRILDLAATHGQHSSKPAVVRAYNGDGRLAVVLALAEEVDGLQQDDRVRRFTLAQSTNDADPPYTHGVFVNLTWDDVGRGDEEEGHPG